MTNPLDRFRRQAKDLKKAHEAGEPHAVTRVRAILKGDAAALRHADYLHVLARENGHASWPAMKATVEALGLDRAEKLNRLKIALFHGQTGVVEALLADTPDLADGHLGLLVALYERDKVAALLAQDPSRATRPLGPRSAILHLAGSRMIHAWPLREADMFAIAEALLAHGADVNDRMPQPGTDHGLSALFFALGHAGNVPLARWLLEHGADPNDGESLYHATELGHHDGLRLLLEFGADPKGTNALPRAMDFHDHDAVELLLRAGADPNEFADGPVGGEEPFVIPALHQAARRGSDARMIDLLLDAGADPGRVWQGVTAYGLACVYGHKVLRDRLEALGDVPVLTPAEQLLAAAARGEAPEGFIDPARLPGEYRDILRTLVADPERLDHVKRLVAIGVEYDRPDPVEQITPVQVAGWQGLPEMMGYLLSLAPDLSHVNGYGGTLLSTIIHGSENCPDGREQDHIGCARMALEHGVALPRKAADLAAEPGMAAFLADWAQAHPGSVVEGGVV